MNKRNVFEEIREQNTKVLNSQINEYFRAKGKKDKRTRATQEIRQKLNEIERQIKNETPVDKMKGKVKRAVSKLVMDGILTSRELIPDEGQDLRTRALVEVLISIDEDDYEILKELFGDGKIIIEIPHKNLAGHFRRVAKFADAILYLSPELESRLFDYVLMVVSHELSHVLLHSNFSTEKGISLQEAEAELQSKAWGF